MSRRVADYVAVALIAKFDWEDEEKSFAWAYGTQKDFSGDLNELKAYAEERSRLPLSDEIISQAVRVLAECGLLRVMDDNYSGTFVKIKGAEFPRFIEKAKAELENVRTEGDEMSILTRPSDYPNAAALMNHELFEDYHELGEDWIRRALQGLKRKLDEDGRLPEADQAVAEEVPASDRLVTIDHNSQEYSDLVEKTEAASESIRSSNSIDEDRRGWIRTHLSAGLEFIKNHKVLAAAASALLLKPLMNAYEAVTEEPAKQAILAAMEAVRAMFGL